MVKGYVLKKRYIGVTPFSQAATAKQSPPRPVGGNGLYGCGARYAAWTREGNVVCHCRASRRRHGAGTARARGASRRREEPARQARKDRDRRLSRGPRHRPAGAAGRLFPVRTVLAAGGRALSAELSGRG